MAKRKKKPGLLSLRLRKNNCQSCDFACQFLKVISCQNPRCREVFLIGQIDAWEIYDNTDCFGRVVGQVCICPACDVPMPGYDIHLICPNDIPQEQQSLLEARHG